jgi:hypothetical protein
MDAGERRLSRRSDGPALLVLFCAVALVFEEGLRGLVPMMRDFAGLTFPSQALWRQEILSGDLSGWNPLAGIGAPRLLSLIHGPGNFLVLVGSIETGLVVTWIAHAALGGLGGYALARDFRVRPAAALVSGTLWAFGGYAASMWWNGEKALTCAWLPWFAFAARRAAPQGTGSLAHFGVALSLAMIVYAGDPFFLFHGTALALAVILADPHPRGLRGRAASLGGVAFSAALGLGLAAPALVPAVLASGDTRRAAALPRHLAEAWSLHPARLPEIFVPGWFGNPFDVAHYPGGAFADDPALQALPWAVSIYAGAAVVLFAPLARSRRVLGALGGVSLLFVLLALGRHTPLHELARAFVPGLWLMRYPEKHIVVAIGLLGVLAALGIERVLSERVGWMRAAWGPAALIGLAAILAPAPLRASALAGATHVSIAVIALLVVLGVASSRPRFVWAIGLVSVVDLAIAARPLFRWVPRESLASPFAAAIRAREHLFPPRLFRPQLGDFEDPATLPGACAEMHGIGAIPGHDPASSPRLEALRSALANRPMVLAQMLAFDALLLPADYPIGRQPDVSARGWSLYLLPPPPRAWLVGSARRAAPDQALLAIASPSFDPFAEALVTSRADEGLATLSANAPGAVGRCDVVSYRSDEIVLTCTATGAGMAVISELDADGWTAEVDDRPERIYETELVLRGVRVSAGDHRLTLRHATPGLGPGFAVASLSGLILLLAAARRRRLRQSAPSLAL